MTGRYDALLLHASEDPIGSALDGFGAVRIDAPGLIE